MVTEEQKAFGRELRRRREEAGYTPDEFARMIGIASRTLQSVELGSQAMGEASRMKAEAALASPPGMHVAEEPSRYGDQPPNEDMLRTVSRIVTTPGFGEKVLALARLLGIDQRDAAEIVLTQEMRKKKA